MSETTYRKKLIEVALPLEAINVASAREKAVKVGKPTSIHLWWARRPLVACRAVLFSSIVDDPSSLPELFPTEEAQEAERQRLFRIIEELVLWENSNNERVLHNARTEIARSVARDHDVTLPRTLGPAQVADALRQYAPPVLDPFCGGGSIPLEAQRLGLEAHGSDLNPVAVLITKALIEIPPKFANQSPVNPDDRRRSSGAAWQGAAGLAADVRYYGKWMRDEAFKRIGHLYPKMQLPPEQGGGEATVIAWLWARTVTCPNPACGARMPLVRSFVLSTKRGKQAWIEPSINQQGKSVSYEVRSGDGIPRDGTVNRQGATCVVCNTAVPFAYIRAEEKAHRLNADLMAVVAEGNKSRAYISPTDHHRRIAEAATGGWRSDAKISHWPGRTNVVEYGMTEWGDLFTDRQLVALTTFSDLGGEARERVLQNAYAAGLSDATARAYSDAVATYLSFAIDRMADWGSSLSRWESKAQVPQQVFGRHAIPMVWDYAECNPYSESTGSFMISVINIIRSISVLPTSVSKGHVRQLDAMSQSNIVNTFMVSTDPPYYDNIGYADLSDFFYVWLKYSLRDIYPDVLSTILTPKANELIASPYRHHGNKELAHKLFESGLQEAITHIMDNSNRQFPVTVFYAFKQSESGDSGPNSMNMASTGWETTLEGVMHLRSETPANVRDDGARRSANDRIKGPPHRPRLTSDDAEHRERTPIGRDQRYTSKVRKVHNTL